MFKILKLLIKGINNNHALVDENDHDNVKQNSSILQKDENQQPITTLASFKNILYNILPKL